MVICMLLSDGHQIPILRLTAVFTRYIRVNQCGSNVIKIYVIVSKEKNEMEPFFKQRGTNYFVSIFLRQTGQVQSVPHVRSNSFSI